MIYSPDYDCLYSIAEDQLGYFTTSQAKKCGFSWERLVSLTKSNKFKRIYQGIYRIVHYPRIQNEELVIAQLKSGERSVLSHDSALAVYGLSDHIPAEIHITIPRTASRRRKGVRYHTKAITKDEITLYEGLRVTTVPRTIIDLIESGFNPNELKLVIEQAIQRGLTNVKELLRAAGARRKSTRVRLNHYLGKIEHEI